MENAHFYRDSKNFSPHSLENQSYRNTK